MSRVTFSILHPLFRPVSLVAYILAAEELLLISELLDYFYSPTLVSGQALLRASASLLHRTKLRYASAKIVTILGS